MLTLTFIVRCKCCGRNVNGGAKCYCGHKARRQVYLPSSQNRTSFGVRFFFNLFINCMKNFKRPKGEKPYYYASTVEEGKVIKHEGEIEHAMYLSEMKETSRRANLWHAWVEKNVKKAYDGLGIINRDVYEKYSSIREEFMDGLRTK